MKKAVFFVTIILLVFVFGCTTGSDSNKPDEVYSGTQGIVMSYVAQNPPSEIFENEPMSVIIEYANRGATDIQSGKLFLTGYDPSYIFGSSPKVENLNGLKGKSLINPTGDEKIIEFATNVVKKPDDIDKFPQKLKLTACYKYQTHTSAKVCIDPTPYKIREGKKTCTVGSVSLSGGQGAPVGVTKIDELIGGDRIQFKIYFKNLGTGEVYNSEKGIDGCLSNLEYSDMDVVTVLGAKYSSKSLSCEPTKVRLVNNEGYTFCYGTIQQTGDEYLTTLNIDLQYNYRESIMRDLTILDIPGVSSGTGTMPGTSGDEACSAIGGTCKWTSQGCSGTWYRNKCLSNPSTEYLCCVSSGSSSETQTCGELCSGYNGHSSGDDWCRCLRTGGSCPTGFISRGTSSDGCNPCCAKA